MTGPGGPAPARSFGRFVADAAAAGQLVVQPRMGFGDPVRMRAGLERTRFAAATTVGTLTIDSYTRVGDLAGARAALAEGVPLNGYPITAHPVERTRALLAGVRDDSFPVQVRHGSSRPEAIIRALTAAGLDATEGGPVSYCLPYGRTPLRESVDNWARGCELLAELAPPPRVPHLETFGGCMLGQLCPPGLLVALSLLEGLFFVEHGIREISLSYAQQTDRAQDTEAVRALRRLAAEFLPPAVDWHVVLYTYMGVYPATEAGAYRLLRSSARLAVLAGAQRLIVKTAAEAHRIPTVGENVRALEVAAEAAAAEWPSPRLSGPGVDALDSPYGVDGLMGPAGADAPEVLEDSEVYVEARAFVEAVLGIGKETGAALRIAFDRGYLDIPYCLHPDNAGRSRSFVDAGGRLRWSRVGAMPVAPGPAPAGGPRALTADGLLAALYTVAQRHDRPDLYDATDRPGPHRPRDLRGRPGPGDPRGRPDEHGHHGRPG